jgi:hypothetical protein
MQDGWIGIANKDTTEALAPQPQGGSKFLLGGAPTDTNNYNGVVTLRTDTTFTKPGFVKQIWLHVSDISEDVHRQMYIRVNGATRAVSLPVIDSAGWNKIFIGEEPMKVGDTLALALEMYKYTAGAEISGVWLYGNATGGDPTSGQWTSDAAAGSSTELKVSKTDKNGVDLSADLAAAPVGALGTFTDFQLSDRYVTYRIEGAPVDGGTFFTFPVSVSATGLALRVGYDHTGVMSTEASQSTDYLLKTDAFATAPYFCTASSSVKHSGTSVDIGDDGVGFEIIFQEAYVSPDWVLIGKP